MRPGDTSADSAARFDRARRRREKRETPRAWRGTVLQQIQVGSEYRYRDVATGRMYTAIEARRIEGPRRVIYAPPLTDREVR